MVDLSGKLDMDELSKSLKHNTNLRNLVLSWNHLTDRDIEKNIRGFGVEHIVD